jgi:hypothetical protein
VNGGGCARAWRRGPLVFLLALRFVVFADPGLEGGAHGAAEALYFAFVALAGEFVAFAYFVELGYFVVLQLSGLNERLQAFV